MCPIEPAPSLAPAPLHIARSPDGALVYTVDRAPAELPPVSGRDLAAAWDASRDAARAAMWGDRRRFRFSQPDGSTTDLALLDRDASSWAAGVEQVAGLHSLYGLSLCLRLLALVDLLARARWADGLCRLRRGGAELHPALLRAAASAELTNEARFDETRFRAGLSVLAPPSGACV